MNISTSIGFLAAIAVFLATALMSFDSLMVLVDLHAFIIVVGGTLSVTCICFPLGKLFTLMKVFFKRIFGINKHNFLAIIEEISALSKAYRKSFSTFESSIREIHDPFLKDAASVLFWLESDVSHADLRSLLENRVATHFTSYTEEAKIFKTLAKFPPAFGLVGTTVGMITLLQSLGGPDSADKVGPSMAIALIATLYGLIMTNFIFSPVAENLVQQTQEDLVARNIVVEGVMLIAEQKPTKYIEEKLKSFLLPKQWATEKK